MELAMRCFVDANSGSRKQSPLLRLSRTVNNSHDSIATDSVDAGSQGISLQRSRGRGLHRSWTFACDLAARQAQVSYCPITSGLEDTSTCSSKKVETWMNSCASGAVSPIQLQVRIVRFV